MASRRRRRGLYPAFTLRLQRRFYTPVFAWSAHTGQLKTLEARSLKALLPSRYPAWGTTTEFARWSGTKAIVRIFNSPGGDDDVGPNPGVFVEYDTATGEVAVVK